MSCSVNILQGGTIKESEIYDSDIFNSTLNNTTMLGGVELDKVTAQDFATALAEDISKIIHNILSKEEIAKATIKDLVVNGNLNLDGRVTLSDHVVDQLQKYLKDGIDAVATDNFLKNIKDGHAYILEKGTISGATTIDAAAGDSIYTAIEELVSEAIKEGSSKIAKEAIEEKLKEELSLKLSGAVLSNGITIDAATEASIFSALKKSIEGVVSTAIKGIKDLDRVKLTNAILVGGAQIDEATADSIYHAIHERLEGKFADYVKENFECVLRDLLSEIDITVVTGVEVLPSGEEGFLNIKFTLSNLAGEIVGEEDFDVPTKEGIELISTTVTKDLVGTYVKSVTVTENSGGNTEIRVVTKDIKTGKETTKTSEVKGYKKEIEELKTKYDKEIEDLKTEIEDLRMCTGCFKPEKGILIYENTEGEIVRKSLGSGMTTIEDAVKVLSWGEHEEGKKLFLKSPELVSVPKEAPKWMTHMGGLFYGATKFNDSNVIGWDVSHVHNFANMFRDATSFNQPIGGWDMSGATETNGMFRDATSFNQPIGDWDVSNVENMIDMFRGAIAFNKPIGDWDVSSVIKMSGLFEDAKAFNQPIGRWDVSNVEYMSSMFKGAISFNQDISMWKTYAVVDMSKMFLGAVKFNKPVDLWDTSKVVSMESMFNGASSFNQSLMRWNVSSVEDMTGMFARATSFNQWLQVWDVSKVMKMERMFEGASKFNQDLSKWCVSNIKEEPSSFDRGATSWTESRPVWGTCPGK